MADISSFTHKWRATPTGGHTNESNKVNKRNRQPVSCAPCRTRKLKCDRGHPCDACSKRGDEDACIYGKVNASTTSRRDDSKSNIKAQERLRHLEELVKQMIGPEKSIPTPQTPPSDGQPPDGSMSKDDNGCNYTGPTHWAAILNQIQELRDTLSPASSTEYDDSSFNSISMDMLFSAPQPPPLHVIVQRYLPSKEECNRYLSSYFRAKYTTVMFIHTYQFKRQYEKFWQNQNEVSPIWASMLFSILCMAEMVQIAPLFSYQTIGESRPRHSKFLTAAAQCLVLGNFTKPQAFIVEALSMYGQCKYALTLDPSHELGIIFSIISRQAYAMGYHREPSVFGDQFTVFEAEMRRRCWSLLLQFDMMVSFQVGLPVIFQAEASDTRPPSHLLDEDFDEDSTVLPPARPDTEFTQMLYLITKARLVETFGRMCQHSLSFPKQPVTEDEIMKLDAAIQSTTDTIPSILRARPIALAYTDPTSLTMVRSNLFFLGEKSRLVLHRKYMSQGSDATTKTGNIAGYSREVCLTSSMKMINYFLELHAEFQPGGQLSCDRWMMTSFTITDFLLALMVLCLAFSLGRKALIDQGGRADEWLTKDKKAFEQYQVLERALPVCAEYGLRAKEARSVAAALNFMLSKLRPKQQEQQQPKQEDVDKSSIAQSQFQPPVPANGLNPYMNQTFDEKIVDEKTSLDADMDVNLTPLSIHNRSIDSSNTGISASNQTNGVNPPSLQPNFWYQPQETLSSEPKANYNFIFQPLSESTNTPDYESISTNSSNPAAVAPLFTPSSSSASIIQSTFDTTNPLSNNLVGMNPTPNSMTTSTFTNPPPFPNEAVWNETMMYNSDGSTLPFSNINILEGPESIDWAQFDQYLGLFGGGGGDGGGENLEDNDEDGAD